VLTLFLKQQRRDDSEGLTRKTSKLHLIDLAGSERSDAAMTVGERLREGANINLSLSALGNVINALTSKRVTHIPYRSSKLTRLLQDSLGGNAVTVMICNVTPASICGAESISSLRFAQRAKRIKNKAVVNQDPRVARINSLLHENSNLRERLQDAETRAERLAGKVERLEAQIPLLEAQIRAEI
jgi:hypothetical protein